MSSLVFDDDDEDGRPRVLSNVGVLRYITAHWMREPIKFGFARASPAPSAT
jgi:hypothetical protein